MSCAVTGRLKSVVPTSPAFTTTVRTRVECETKRASHASCDVWKMSTPNRTAQGIRDTALFTPPPTPLPPVSVKPNVGRRSCCWSDVSTSKSQTGKFDSVPPSMITARCCFSSRSVSSRKLASRTPRATAAAFSCSTSMRSAGVFFANPSVSPGSSTSTRSRTSWYGSKKYGIDMLMRAASAISNCIGVDRPVSRRCACSAEGRPGARAAPCW